MADKEAALVINQKLVQFGFNRLGDAKAFGDALDYARQGFGPGPAREFDATGIDLPGAPNVDVNQGLHAAAERCAFGDGDQLLGLDRQERQGDGADTVDLETWRKNLADASGAEIALTLDPVQQLGKIGGDR
jgi:hypothetical protein